MSNHLKLQHDIINIDEINKQIGSADCGAITLFIGQQL
jgi:hypothetical protein